LALGKEYNEIEGARAKAGLDYDGEGGDGGVGATSEEFVLLQLDWTTTARVVTAVSEQRAKSSCCSSWTGLRRRGWRRWCRSNERRVHAAPAGLDYDGEGGDGGVGATSEEFVLLQLDWTTTARVVTVVSEQRAKSSCCSSVASIAWKTRSEAS